MDIEHFLSGKIVAATGSTAWDHLGMSFRLVSYLGSDLPPSKFVTSVRAIVKLSNQVVILENDDGEHYLPGGRIEPGESYMDTLTREVKEECGLDVRSAELMGFIHFHHTTPQPDPYPYPYPDMVHLVYDAQATGTLRSGDLDGWEKGSRLALAEEASLLEAMDFALPFLRTATGA